jgi:uncharacterized membrane protein YbhN (UPF0104 family)
MGSVELQISKWARTLALFAICGVAIYFYAIWSAGGNKVIITLGQIDFLHLIIAALLSSLTYLVRFVRWHFILEFMGYRLPTFANLRIYLCGLALTASPGKLGETLRSALLLPHGVRLRCSLAAFLADRAGDVIGLLALGAVFAVATDQPSQLLWVVSLLSAYIFSNTLAHGIKGRGLLGMAVWVHRRPTKWMLHLYAPLKAWAKVWTPGWSAACGAVAMVAYGAQAWVFCWLCNQIGAQIGVADAVLIFVAATLFGAASMIPGGLGAMEAALVIQLQSHGVPLHLAIAGALAIRLATLWTGMAIGVLALAFSLPRAHAKN